MNEQNKQPPVEEQTVDIPEFLKRELEKEQAEKKAAEKQLEAKEKEGDKTNV